MTKPRKTQDEVAASRFELIARLADEGLDRGLRRDIMSEITESSGVSERTVRRWVCAWKEKGFDGLKPSQGYTRPDSRLPASFESVVSAAIGLRRESPSRSVGDIIKILELEEAIPPGSVSRSTLQRRLQEKGYGASQVRMYIKKGAAARRFQKEHRCQLWQSDVKYASYAADKEGGRKKQTYLVVWIDDATRFIVAAKFYMNQDTPALEDSLRTAIQKYGAPDAIYVDKGSAYRSDWLKSACAKIGTRYLSARAYHPEGKGKVERFNRTIAKFLSEAALKKFETLAEYNEYLKIWLEEYYGKEPHLGIGSVSPNTAFATDSRPLRFVAEGKLREAFLHMETRKVDKTGCVSFSGDKYEAGLAYIGRRIEIGFDLSWGGEILVCPESAEPFVAKRLSISEDCGTRQGLPEGMKPLKTDTSRMLDALKKEYVKHKGTGGVATSFKEFWEGKEDV